MNHILSKIPKIILSILLKNETLINNPPVKIYINKIQNRITFKIKTGYNLELLTPETMKLLGSIENMITKDENGESKFQVQYYK